MVAKGNGLHKVVVVLRVTSYDKFPQLLLLRERTARWDYWEQTACSDWWDITWTFTGVASTNQHQTHDAASPATLLFVLRGYHQADSGHSRVIGSDVLSVDGVGGLIDELGNVGQTPAGAEKKKLVVCMCFS